ncbi:hypothetical protein KPH14_008124 [Odynerus spinipes]|uniref:PH domain-containing protein n=1 Tax=Odynerus spinipes TaxID=1348599 RepID=A0AAD9VNP9_9HYME|nr:hypothetical protein KPH14_008124 [Odynerus spinipes]
MIVSNATDIREEESFTRRFLRRATTNTNDSFTKASNDTRRKLNILQAINDSTTELTTGITEIRDKNHRSNFPNPEEFKTSKRRTDGSERNKLAKTNGLFSRRSQEKNIVCVERSTKDINRTSVTKEFEKADNGWTYYDKTMPSCNIVTPKLVKVKRKHLPTAERMYTVPVESIIESGKSNFDVIEEKSEIRSYGTNGVIVDKNLNESIDMDRTNETFAPYAGLNEAIRDLERDIELLELKPSARDAYTSETSFRLRSSLENWDGKSNEIYSNDNATNSIDLSMPDRQAVAPLKYKKNSAFSKTKKPKRMMPNLESTRKSSIMDLTKKNTSPSSIPSTISTITTATSLKFMTGDRNDENDHNASSEVMDNTIPSEVEKFLENALGDEMYDTSCITNATLDSMEAKMCRLNKSQLTEEPVTPPSDKIRNIRPPASEPPLQDASTLNRTLVFYRSLSQRIKKKFRPRLKDKARPTEIPVPITILHQNDKVQALLQELEIQQTLIHQTSKALNLCNVIKKFQRSTQHIESERLLLLSTLKKRAVLNEIKRISASNENAVILSERGEVNISNIALCLREDILFSRNLSAEMTEWFIVTVSHESMVWATIAMSYSTESSKLCFPGSLSIGNLTPNFKITLSVYSLQLRNTNCNKKEERSGDHNVSCPSPTNLWKKVEKTRSKQNEIHCSSVRDTSFKLSGYVELTLQDIPLPSPWPLSMVPLNSMLQGTIDLDLSCKLHISVTHAGFLTHGDEAGGFAVWNRRWCVLEGYILKFWNYPQEQELKPPLLLIDLTHCISNEVMMVDRTLCAKPRTLMFKTTRERTPQDHNSMLIECGSSRTIVRNLLSCDTSNDLMIWTSKLNYVLSVLRDWNSTMNDEVLTTDL